MFGETTIFSRHDLEYPTETNILQCMFQESSCVFFLTEDWWWWWRPWQWRCQFPFKRTLKLSSKANSTNHMKTLSSFQQIRHMKPKWKPYENHMKPKCNPYENHMKPKCNPYENHMKPQMKPQRKHISSSKPHPEAEKIIHLQGAALRSALMELMKAKAAGGVFQVGVPGEGSLHIPPPKFNSLPLKAMVVGRQSFPIGKVYNFAGAMLSFGRVNERLHSGNKKT